MRALLSRASVDLAFLVGERPREIYDFGEPSIIGGSGSETYKIYWELSLIDLLLSAR